MYTQKSQQFYDWLRDNYDVDLADASIISQYLHDIEAEAKQHDKRTELVQALMAGKVLERNCAEQGTYWHEEKEMMERVEYSPEGDRFYMNGWGTAFGQAEDRVISMLRNPEKWTIVLQNVQASVASKAK